jgi:uncharacterized membrane protein YraQ (UPF0718 family)
MKNNNNKKINGGVKFFLLVIFLYMFLLVFNYSDAVAVFLDFLKMCEKVLPLLFFVFLAMILVNSFLTESVLKKYLGEGKGLKGFVYSTIAGILVSGPSYVLFPMLAELKKKGLSDYHLAIFLYNRNVKIPFFPALVLYFGLAYSIILSIYIIIFSFFNGIILDTILKKKA